MANGNGNGAQAQTKAINAQALADSVQSLPPDNGAGYGGFLTLQLAHEADDIPVWGTQTWLRDRMLRELWPSTPEIAGPIGTIAARNAAMTIKLDGPTRTVDAAQQLFHEADQGSGLISLMMKIALDVYTQDNGAFMETARADYITGEAALKRLQSGAPLPPVTALNHIDSACCMRTGNPINPVIYLDPINGQRHLLPWHMVVPIAEMPSPVKQVRGMQYSALTRILRAAQLMRDISIYKREKVSGRNASEIQLVGGPSNTAIQDAIAAARERADNRGLLRYMEPIIVASLDPTRPVTTATIGWAGLPDGFDADVELKNYITLLAMCLLEDYQTFAPLPGGGLGTSNQSQILERKGRGKGPGLWRKLLTHIFNFYGILPRTVEFAFDETDPVADKEEADAVKAKLDNVIAALGAGIMTVPVARQYCADNAILLDEDYLAMLGDEDATPDETVTDETPITPTGDIDVLSGQGEELPASGGETIPAQAQPAPQQNALPPAGMQRASKDAPQGGGAVQSFFAPLRSKFGAQHAAHKRATPKRRG